MEKKNNKDVEIVELGYRGYFILTSIFLLCACGIIALLINNLKNKNLELREAKEELAKDVIECPNNSVPVYLTKEDLVRNLFSNKLNKEETILEYSIEDIYLEDINQFLGSGMYANNYPTATKDSIFAVITYSVKPNGSIGKSIWINNNGVYEDEWVKEKKSYIHIKKMNGSYVIDGDGLGFKW